MNLRSWSKVLPAFGLLILANALMWGQAASKTGPKYDPTKEVKLKGTVAEVKESPNATEPTLLVVKTGDKTTLVRLAPAEFLKEIDCWIKAGDEVEVVGARVPDTPQEEILARQVTFGNNTMVLRDPKGIPVWETWKPSKTGA